MTNLHTSLTPMPLDQKKALVEQQTMAKAKKPSIHDDDLSSDPIAAALKQMHDAIINEELPDDFLKLLDEIDTKIAAKKAMN